MDFLIMLNKHYNTRKNVIFLPICCLFRPIGWPAQMALDISNMFTIINCNTMTEMSPPNG